MLCRKTGMLKGAVLYAVSETGVSGATLKIRAGWNNTKGTVSASATTDKNGNYSFNLGRALRDFFMSFPVRYGALIAAELGTDEYQTSAILDEYIRKMLTKSQDILSKEI